MKRKGLFRVLSLVLAFCLAALPVAAENLDDWEDLLFKDSSKNKVFVVKRERRGVKKARLEFVRQTVVPTGQF